MLAEDKITLIREKLQEFESMTWSEILIVSKKQNHQIDVSELCQSAQDYLREMSLEDIDQVLSLRLGGKERVWGIFTNGVVELLWWDPDHKICPSPLRNT
jgi:hypothetical protein